MSEASAAETPKVMEKVFNILKRELSAEEYLISDNNSQNRRRNSGTQGHY